MSIAVSAPVTEAALDALRTLGRPIGDGARPPGPNPAPVTFYPFAVLYVGTTDMRGSLVHPREDGLHRLHVACVGRTRESAEAMRDEARALLLDVTSLAIEGYAVVYTEHAGSPETFRDDDVTPPLFNAIAVVNVFVTPDLSGS